MLYSTPRRSEYGLRTALSSSDENTVERETVGEFINRKFENKRKTIGAFDQNIMNDDFRID